jgi:hypothetical protein
MFLRWKKRKLPESKRWFNRKHRPGVLLTAVLVESVRIDGKSRQKTVKYLGSIQQWRIEQAAFFVLRDFWQKVSSELDTVTLTKKTRREIENQITAVVPKPTKAMLRRDMKALSDATKQIAEHRA